MSTSKLVVFEFLYSMITVVTVTLRYTLFLLWKIVIRDKTCYIILKMKVNTIIVFALKKSKNNDNNILELVQNS